MKRALVCLLVSFGFSAFAIGTFSGEWDFEYCFVGGITTNTLTVTYTDFGMDFTGTLSLPDNSFAFAVGGSLGGILDLNGTMKFDIFPPDYNSAQFKTTLTFAGSTVVGVTIDHYSVDDLPKNWQNYCCPCTDPKCSQTPTEGFLLFTVNVEIAPMAIKLIMADCCTGIEFHSIKVTLNDLSLCCGITYDVEWLFDKCGFNYAKFTADPLFELCCGITFGLEVEFGVDYKEISPKIDIDWPGAECLTVGITVGSQATTIEYLTIDYLGIECSLGDCSSLLIGEVFTYKLKKFTYQLFDHTIKIIEFEYETSAPDEWGMEAGGFAYQIAGEQWVGVAYIEKETIQLSLCGAACCGGQWTGDLKAYFADAWYWDSTEGQWVQVFPFLFGMDRVEAGVSVPLGDAFALNFSMTYGLLTGYDVCFGWTFSF